MSVNSNNPFESVLSSFEKACTHLENTSILEMLEVKKQLERDTTSAEEAISEFNQGVKDISAASDKLLQSDALMKTVRENFLKKDCILLSQDLQTDTIDLIKEIYNLNAPFTEASEKKLMINKFKDSNDLIQKVNVRTINQANNVKNALLTNMKLSENI